ncbi:MAG: hypothetical protein KDC24_12330 [Saprospiraceae bacterium]|nr:hypothetical protein [Saprospiraceae bacterium]
MRLMFSLLILCYTLIGNTQTYQFLPDWEVGDTKEITIYQLREEVTEGEEMPERRDTMQGPKITVKSEEKEFFILIIEKDDQTLDGITMFLDGFEEKAGTQEEIPLEVSVSKIDGSVDVHNFDALKTRMDKTLAVIDTLILEKGQGLGGMIQQMLQPIVTAFKDPESLKAYYLEDLDFFLMPFYNPYEQGKIIEVTESAPNPMKPDMEISMTRTQKLANLDKDAGIATFHQETSYDMEEYVEMIKELITQMGDAFGQSDESRAEKEKQFDEFEVDVKMHTNIYFNTNTTWVEKAVTEMVMEGTEPGKGKSTNKVTVTYIVE